jgi:ankyrin repeat protein
MTSSGLSSNQLIALSKNGELEQLSTALQQPATSQIALGAKDVLVDARTGVRRSQLVLKLMLEAAAASGHADTVELLLSFGQQHNVAASDMVDPDTMSAALNEKPLEVLLKFQAVDPAVFTRGLHIGGSLLTASSAGGPNSEDIPRSKYLGLARHLMEIGVDPNNPKAMSRSRRSSMNCPLYMASWMATPEIVETFLAHGAKVKGTKAMHSASCNARIDVLELLLKHGGDINEETEEEDGDGPPGTPLHVAAAGAKADVVRWLLDHGADATKKNCKGMSAKDVAKDDDGTILGLLEKADVAS